MNSAAEFSELIPGLPEELALECLTRLHYSAHSVSSHVCKRWRELLQSKDFYYHRRQTGLTHKAACLIQALLVPADSKPVGQPSYGISLFEPASGDWDRVAPISKYPNGLPLFCQIASTEGKLIVMGGWDPATWDPIRDVFMYEFTTREWTQCKDMPSRRSFFAMGAAGGRVFVAGGHDENKNALRSAWAFDTRENQWTELGGMSEARDECEGIVVGPEFWVVSGYDTETQGRFKSSAEALQMETGEWRRVENAWACGSSQSPRGCVGVDKNGNLRSWTECDPAVRVGSCGIDLGECCILTGSAYQGGPHGFFFVQPQNLKLVKTDVPDEFAGIVQSGCCVEI
nr:F-box/kelch-repeat protein At1g15670-like [Ipomoea batatas]